MSEQPHRDDTPADGVVLPGPWTPPVDAPVGVVLEGDVLDRDGVVLAPAAPQQVRPAQRVVPALPESGRELARTAARMAVQSGQGHVVLARRAADAVTHAAIREQIRAARARGDKAELAEWLDRLQAAKSTRRARIRDLPAVLASAAMSAVAAVVALAGVLLTAGILAGAIHPLGVGWGDYWGFVGWALRTLVTVATVLVPFAGVGAILAWLLITRRVGEDGASLPTRLMPAGQRPDVGEEITPSIVVTAFRDLGYADLRRRIKEMPDYGAGMLSPITTAGCGVEVDVQLPSGTSTEEIQKRHRKLAENLGRHEHEVFISIPAKLRRTVRLWIAEPGALDEPIGPSPLVLDPEMSADYYTGRAPWGQDLRGDALLIRLFQCHLLLTGLSNQGKTASLRALALWLGFDPTVEFWIGDLKGVGDWSMFEGLASRLVEGPTDTHVMAITHMAEDAVAEMERRIEAAKASGSKEGVTREMAQSGQGFHPLVLIVDEAQRAFMCPAVGDDGRPYGGTKAKSRYYNAIRAIHNQGRAVNVTVWQGTQDPTDQNLPKLIREGAHIRGSLVVGTEAQARQALGDKAVDGGAAPNKLRQGLDKGTLVVTGEGVPIPAGASSVTVRTHFIDGEPATEIADRAKARRAQVVTRTPGDEPDERDPLADMLTVLRGADRERTQVVLSRLMELAPAYYESWSTATLRTTLRAFESDATKSSEMYLTADAVRHALTVRADRQAGDE
ncbi:ATP-binding protein [Parafrankia sp. FMc2]|uniref:ATP-binding protein n=1 Tax=Parafrankia sp. FMc2 TaxID=3233196 RepID=UPI0034D5F33A